MNCLNSTPLVYLPLLFGTGHLKFLLIVEYGKSRLIEARTIHGFLDVRRIGLSTRICYLKSNWKLLSANKGLREKSKSIRYLRIIILIRPPPLVTAAAAEEAARPALN
jgi:hypothetical protein